jgi:plastocyanin
MNRGREYQISLRVTKAGVYRLICETHEPTMTAEIVVLPRPSS